MTRYAVWVGLFGWICLGGWAVAQQESRSESEQRIESLIADLGSPRFEVRQRASRELQQIGESARKQLEAATRSEDPEVVWRVRKLLDRLGRLETKRPDRAAPPSSEKRSRVAPSVRRRTFSTSRRFTSEDEAALRALGKGIEELARQFGKPLPSDGDPEGTERIRRVGRVFEAFTDEFLKVDPEAERQWKDAKRMVRTFWALAEGRPLPAPEDREAGRERVLPVPETRPDSIRELSSSLRLGVRGAPVGPATRVQLGLEGRHGVWIEKVNSGSSGDRSGLRRGDVLLAVDGRGVGTMEEVDQRLSKIAGKRSIRMRLQRAGRTIELSWKR